LGSFRDAFARKAYVKRLAARTPLTNFHIVAIGLSTIGVAASYAGKARCAISEQYERTAGFSMDARKPAA
jgi:hypothetical protein